MDIGAQLMLEGLGPLESWPLALSCFTVLSSPPGCHHWPGARAVCGRLRAVLTPKEGVLEKCREAPWRQGVLGSTGAQEEVWRPVRYGGSGRRAECQPELGVQPCPVTALPCLQQ